MIQEAYVSYEIAQLLKKKGFDGDGGDCECHMFYCEYTEERIFPICEIGLVSDNEEVFFAPTHQMACAWLREVHLIHIYAEYKAFFQEKPKKEYYHWMPFVRTLPNCSTYNSGFLDIYCDSHEEAIEAALKYTLENLL